MTTLEMSEQDPNMEEDENNEMYKDEPIVITIPGIDHLDEWMILELERKKRLIGYLEQIGDDDVAEIKNYWFPNGVDGVPNLEPYQRFLKPAEEDEQDEESKRREEQEFIEKSDPLHIDRGMQRVSKVFKNAGSTIASYWKSTLRPTLSIAKKTPEEIANEPSPLKVLTSPYWLMGLSLVYVGASYNIYRSFGHKVNSVLLSYAFYKSAKMINNNEMNGYRWAAAASAAAFFTSIATTSQRRDLAPIYRPKYVGPRYFTLISIPFFAYYYNRIQTVPLVQEIKQTKEVIIDSFDKSREWVKTTIKRWRGNKPEGEAHGDEEDIDFLKQASDIKKQEMKANVQQRRGGGLPMDDDDE